MPASRALRLARIALVSLFLILALPALASSRLSTAVSALGVHAARPAAAHFVAGPPPSGAAGAYPLNETFDADPQPVGTPPANSGFEAAPTNPGTPPADSNFSTAPAYRRHS